MDADTPVASATWPWNEDLVLSRGTIDVRPTTRAEAELLFDALDDDAVWEHVKGRPESTNQMRDVIDTSRDMGRWMWTIRDSGRVVGSSSFMDVSLVDARVEIGHTTYACRVWGTFVNPTCKLLLMSWAFDHAGMNRVQLKTDLRNLRSQGAIERLGATREGVLRSYQKRQNGTIRDTVMYSVLASEWTGVKTGLLDRLSD
jgi:RimJ/RimL family protein N-acetyltransferase